MSVRNMTRSRLTLAFGVSQDFSIIETFPNRKWHTGQRKPFHSVINFRLVRQVCVRYIWTQIEKKMNVCCTEKGKKTNNKTSFFARAILLDMSFWIKVAKAKIYNYIRNINKSFSVRKHFITKPLLYIKIRILSFELSRSSPRETRPDPFNAHLKLSNIL